MQRSAPFAAACLLSLAAAGAAAQTLYKCTLPDGRTVYQDSKCDDDAKAKVMPAPSSPSGGTNGPPVDAAECLTNPGTMLPSTPEPGVGPEPSAARQARMELPMVVEVLRSYQGCSAEVPAFAGTYGGAYREWRQKYADALARYERTPAARRMVDCARALQAKRSAEEKSRDGANITAYCMQSVGPGIQQLNARGLPQ